MTECGRVLKTQVTFITKWGRYNVGQLIQGRIVLEANASRAINFGKRFHD